MLRKASTTLNSLRSQQFYQTSAAPFSYVHNLHNPTHYWINGHRHMQDYDLEEYSSVIKSYLTRRRTVKREVPAKMAILRDLGKAFRHVYQQQKLVPGDQLYEEKNLKRLYESDDIDSQFLHSIWTEPYEKPLLGYAMQKLVMNGSVVPMLEKPKHDEIKKEITKVMHTFYEGDQLTNLERDVQRMYLGKKLDKQNKYKSRKNFRFKVRWTISDLNRYQEQESYRMNSPEYFGIAKPRFMPFDLDVALDLIPVHQDIMQTSRIRKALSWFTDQKAFERGSKRSKLQSQQLMSRAFLYMDSWEFVNNIDLEEDFHIHNSVANLHIWLIYQRLRDFSENKFAHQLREELIENFNAMINNEMEGVDVLRRHKKIEDIDNYLFAIRRNLDFHFFINGCSVDDPAYKLDALVWTSVFHEKVPRYSNKVYRMSAYLLENYYYLKTLSYSDIEKGNIEWGAYRVPANSEQRFTRIAANLPLSPEEFEKEFNSPYKTKKYHYSYRHENELSEENMKKTFVNLCSTAYIQNKDLTVRAENMNLDTMNSEEKKEAMYKMKIELENLSQLPDDNESFFSSISASNPLQNKFKMWKKNLTIPLKDQLEEHAQRKMDEYETNQQREELKDQAYFSARAHGEEGTGDDQVYDMDINKKKNERHQAILRQTIAEEKGETIDEADRVKPVHEKQGPFMETVDKLPQGAKRKWRLW